MSFHIGYCHKHGKTKIEKKGIEYYPLSIGESRFYCILCKKIRKEQLLKDAREEINKLRVVLNE